MTAITRCTTCNEWTQGFHLCANPNTVTPLGVAADVRKSATKPSKRRSVDPSEPSRPSGKQIIKRRNQAICEQYANGANYAAIALVHNMTEKRVGEIVRASGVERRANQYAPARRQELAGEILRLHANGTPQKQIATIAHTSTETIRRVLREHNVKPRPNAITNRITVRHTNTPKVLELVKAGGKTQAQIAAELGIAVTTVERILRAERQAS